MDHERGVQAERVVGHQEFDSLSKAYSALAEDRNFLSAELSALRRAFQQPYIDTQKINDLQMESIRKLIPRLRQAHFTNLRIRINGAWEEVECDWLKHLVLPDGRRLTAPPDAQTQVSRET